MKKLLMVMALVAAGCGEKPVTEYRAVMFCREDITEFDTRLKQLFKDGFRYAGPLHQNGINCTNVLFVK